MEKESTFFAKEKKNVEGKGGKYLEKENIIFMEEKKNIEVKGGNIWRKKMSQDNEQTHKET